MINIPQARNGLAAVLEEIAPAGTTVEPEAPDGVPAFPLALVGMPAWNADGPTYGFTTWTFPIAVLVDRAAGGGDRASIEALDATWPAVLAGLRSHAEDDQTLGGICIEAVVSRAQFGLYTLAGIDYPAQLIFVDLYG